MAVTTIEWENWLDRLYNLRRDKSGSHERPHKPALLLSIIDLLDRGGITRNEVPLSDELVTTFKRYWYRQFSPIAFALRTAYISPTHGSSKYFSDQEFIARALSR